MRYAATKCCVRRMLVADKHDCVEQKMRSRNCLRKVGTPASFTQSSTILQLVLQAHRTGCTRAMQNVSAEYPSHAPPSPRFCCHFKCTLVFNDLLHASVAKSPKQPKRSRPLPNCSIGVEDPLHGTQSRRLEQGGRTGVY
jgi:hypothetical protein